MTERTWTLDTNHELAGVRLDAVEAGPGEESTYAPGGADDSRYL